MINRMLDLYIFLVLLYTLYKLLATAKKTAGGLVGQAMIFFCLGFTIIFLLMIQSILETSFNMYVSDVFGRGPTAIITRFAQAAAFLTFAIGAAKLEKIGR